MKIKKRKILNIVLHLALIFELAVFQFAWPFAIARAETADPANGTIEEQMAEEESGDTNNTEEENIEEAEEQKNPKDFWKTCDLTDEEKDLIEKDKCEKCREETSCEKIKICLSVFIDIENGAEVENDASASADTGGNSIVVEEENYTDEQVQEENTDENETEANILDEQLNNPEDSPELQENGDEPQSKEETCEAECENNEKGNSDHPDGDNNDEGDGDNDNSDSLAAEEELQMENQNENSAEIETGDAVAEADIYNEVNTNIIGENVEKVTENIDGVFEGDINLLEKFDSLLENASSDDEGTLVEINIDNTATVENDAEASAETGENSITGAGDEALITTGDALAAANIVNIVNLNLVGNNWLFATINIFGEWIGDLIVPGEGLLSAPGSSGVGDVSITTDNTATVENNAEANADTGNDSIEGKNGSASIETGNAQASSSVKNVVNTTIIKNNWFFLVINNMGSWVGKAIHWGGDENSESYSYDFDKNESWEGNIANWFASIFIKNTAVVTNSASASAETGGNSIDGDFENASVKTGNANARANIWNFVNTNIIGSNWMFATVNIFGSWKGNVDFAYPDLAIALTDGKEKAQNGDELTYSVKYKNVGSADCDGVDVQVALPQYVDFQGDSSGVSPEMDSSSFTWHLPGLKAGEEKSFNVSGLVSNSLPEGEFALSALAAVKTSTKEVEMENNVSSDETVFYHLADGTDDDSSDSQDSEDGDDSSGDSVMNSALSISRKINDKKVKPGDIVKHTIVVENTGEETLTSVILQDNLKNKKGEVGTYQWEIGKLGKGQKAIITYSLQINAWAPSGDYKSKASASGYDPEDQEVKSSESRMTFHVDISDEDSQQEYYYYQYYENYPPVEYLEGNSGIINAAEAAGPEEMPQGKTLGAWTNPGVCIVLPLVFWLMALLAYVYVVNWSVFPKKKKIK